MREIQINTEPTELYKILKFEGLAASGGEAKFAIEQGLVSVNGQIELRKRRKIHAGDIIGLEQEKFLISLVQSDPQRE